MKAENQGCEASDEVVVSVFVPVEVYNTFSPNGDGVNDEWSIDGLERYEKVSIKIFDRWGQKVYEERSGDRVWDGKVNGTTVPVGTYYYIVDLEDPIEDNQTLTGYMTVIK